MREPLFTSARTTGPGAPLGPHRPRNAEASLRLELPLAPGDLDGTGASLASEVNRHLLLAYNLSPCLAATFANKPAFIAWAEKACNRAPRSSLDEVTVVLAVRTSAGMAVSALPWADLIRHGIYLQALDEAGRPVWDGGERILVLVWLSATDLQAGGQPVILRCQVTTNNAGPGSHLQGTNQSRDPIAGFRGVILDRQQLAATKQSRHSPRLSLPIWSGRPVECYDFEFPTPHADSSQVDAGVTPMYQFHLKVEAIAFPADRERPATAEFVWSRESFAVADSRKSARYQRMDGYPVSEGLRQTILRSLVETLQIDLDEAKVLPISEYDQARLGKRISSHALHETFLGERSKRRRDEYYQRARPGMLVAELDEQVSAEDMMSRGGRRPEALPRVQRDFTMPLDELAEIWAETARQLRAGTSEGDRS